jgi:uncharacterized RDD family membrane protein YckC
MYPQTPEETERTNIILAVVYGAALLLSFFFAYLLMLPGMFLAMPAMFEGISIPDSMVGSGDNLYVLQKQIKDINFFDPENVKEIVVVQYYDGESWQDGPELGDCGQALPRGEGLLWLGADEITVVVGATVSRIVEYDLPPNSSAARHGQGLLILALSKPDFFSLSYLDKDLSLKWSRELAMPSSFPDRENINFRVASSGARLWLLWKTDNRLYHSLIGEQKIEEPATSPFYLSSYTMVAVTDRAMIIAMPPVGGSAGSGRQSKIMELDDRGEWSEVEKLTFSGFDTELVMATRYRGNLVVLSAGLGSSWRELKNGRWVDRSDELPPQIKSIFGSMFSNMFSAIFKWMGIGMIWWIALPLAVVAVAHFHFKARKNPRVVMGENAGEAASVGRRSAAYAVDMAVTNAPGWALTIYFFLKLENMSDPFEFFSFMGVWMMASLAVMFVPLIYFFALESLWGGRTLGKRLFRIRVVMEDGSPLTVAGSVIRNLLRLVDMFLYYLPAIISVAATTRYQRIGDLAGKTLVVRERDGRWMEPLSGRELDQIREREAARQAAAQAYYRQYYQYYYPQTPPDLAQDVQATQGEGDKEDD